MLGMLSKADRDAEFTRFMAEASPSLTRTAWLLTGDAERSQELVQAALIKTYAAWPKVRRDSALAYARRILINHRTDTWRRTHDEITTDQLPERPFGDGSVGVEQRDQVVRLLATLPPQQRTVIVLRYYTDLSEQATAEALGISVGAVKSAASRGLATLRTHLAATEGGSR